MDFFSLISIVAAIGVVGTVSGLIWFYMENWADKKRYYLNQSIEHSHDDSCEDEVIFMGGEEQDFNTDEPKV
jgi:hypothetical protein